ncbi:MAG: Glutamine-hydrolyzing GMP synthase [Candidatus Levybacteria bacterium GW2011_GWA2_40_8]|nr:MAG: Glutamine-hydrolyzing GMP synthase [Candidatus Levybacteria bacterium GW2011_GWA2_40_8]
MRGKSPKILVVDFGSQTAHLITRRLKDLGIESSLVDPDEALKVCLATNPQGIILSGGPASVYEKGAPSIDKKIYELGIPILGICYGQQFTAYILKGGKTVKDKVREDGPATLIIDKSCVLFEGVSPHSRVWMSHGDTVVKAPLGFEFVGHSSL